MVVVDSTCYLLPLPDLILFVDRSTTNLGPLNILHSFNEPPFIDLDV